MLCLLFIVGLLLMRVWIAVRVCVIVDVIVVCVRMRLCVWLFGADVAVVAAVAAVVRRLLCVVLRVVRGLL